MEQQKKKLVYNNETNDKNKISSFTSSSAFQFNERKKKVYRLNHFYPNSSTVKCKLDSLVSTLRAHCIIFFNFYNSCWRCTGNIQKNAKF